MVGREGPQKSIREEEVYLSTDGFGKDRGSPARVRPEGASFFKIHSQFFLHFFRDFDVTNSCYVQDRNFSWIKGELAKVYTPGLIAHAQFVVGDSKEAVNVIRIEVPVIIPDTLTVIRPARPGAQRAYGHGFGHALERDRTGVQHLLLARRHG